MANLIQKDSYVQWTSGTGQVIAKVSKVEGDVLEVTLPSGVSASIGLANVVEITAEEYKKAVSTLIEQLSANVKYQSKDEIAMSQELETVKNELNQVKASLEAALSDKTKLSADLEAATKALTEIKAAQLAQARYDELKAFEAAETVAKDQLGTMSQDQYDMLKNFAKASFDKVAKLQKEVVDAKASGQKIEDVVASAKTEDAAGDVAAASVAPKESDTRSEQDVLASSLTDFSRGLLIKKTKKKSV